MFCPQKLCSLPKRFGLDSQLCKGIFPYLFKQPDFYSYRGEMPTIEYFCTQSMKRKEKIDFEKWYREKVNEGYVFDFRKEILSYAISNVTILREAMQCFRALFEKIAGFNPLFHCLTLSSACMCMYRFKHMPLYKIGIVPQGGYRGRDKQSFIALEWLDFEQHLLGHVTKIKTAENSREVRVLHRPVDGYVEIVLPRGRVEKKNLSVSRMLLSLLPKNDIRTQIVPFMVLTALQAIGMRRLFSYHTCFGETAML